MAVKRSFGLTVSGEHSTRIAENLRRVIEEHDFIVQNSTVKVTASLGVAELHGEDTIAAVLKRADEALYEAKQTGRNKVVVS
jgi:diguanylate cyclase (GGDEF)-like protein